jgi:hypothetical protein
MKKVPAKIKKQKPKGFSRQFKAQAKAAVSLIALCLIIAWLVSLL